MDTTSLYYFQELAKDLHFTRAAKRLYISQQTLSKHIQRLEVECGTPLFIRKPMVALTVAGEEMLKHARTVTASEAYLRDVLADVRTEERGVIRLGASYLRLNMILPKIMDSFIARYPKVELRVFEGVSVVQERRIRDGEIDLAMVVNHAPDPHVQHQVIFMDQMYLCVSDDLLKRYYPDPEQRRALVLRSIKGADIRDFMRLPFCMNDTRTGTIINRIYAEANLKPWIIMTNSYAQLGTTIGLNGTSAIFVNRMSLAANYSVIPDNMNIFPFFHEELDSMQGVGLIWLKDKYVPAYTVFFMKLLSSYSNSIENNPVERIAAGY